MSLRTVVPLAVALSLAGAGAAHAASVKATGGGDSLTLDAARGEYEDGELRLRDVHGRVAVTADTTGFPALAGSIAVLRVASTRVRGRRVADPLPPLAEEPAVDGAARLLVRVRVDDGAAPGVHRALLRLTVDGAPLADVPLTVNVWDAALTARDDPHGFRTLFQVTPQSYINAVNARTGDNPNASGPLVGAALMRFLSEYRISPGDWGYATPRRTGYADGRGWWRRAGSLMDQYGRFPFSTMRLPIDTQRAVSHLTGLSPTEPEGWAPYLREHVLPFWRERGWLDRSLVWGWDEPGDRLDRNVIGPQACAVHETVPEAGYIVTDTPRAPRGSRMVHVPWGRSHRGYRLRAERGDNRFLWDGRGCDDVDVWAVLARRYYGTFATPLERAAGIDEQRRNATLLRTVRRRGAAVWSYTYEGVPGSPGYSAGEPETNPRTFLLWNALEGLDGTLYADGMMTYGKRDPYRSLPGRGQGVLLYPASHAAGEPVSSLRLEGIRDGVEDADLARLVAARHGRAAVRRILGAEDLFSVRKGRTQLACTMGCDLPGRTKFSFPRYRTNDGTAAAQRRVHRALLARLADPPPGALRRLGGR